MKSLKFIMPLLLVFLVTALTAPPMQQDKAQTIQTEQLVDQIDQTDLVNVFDIQRPNIQTTNIYTPILNAQEQPASRHLHQTNLQTKYIIDENNSGINYLSHYKLDVLSNNDRYLT